MPKQIIQHRVSLTAPSGWEGLTQLQLEQLCRFRALGVDAATVRTLCLLRWNDIRVIGRTDADTPAAYLLRLPGGDITMLTPVQLAEAATALEWIDTPPQTPVMLRSLRGRQGVPADFSSTPFIRFITADNLWQGFIFTRDDAMLDRLAAVLYPLKRWHLPLRPWERIAVAIYWASLKEWLARRFPEFFRPSTPDTSLLTPDSQPDPSMVEDAMNAQIRALTKGDVTKEQTVLAIDTLRALAELNAQAHEYRRINELSRQK